MHGETLGVLAALTPGFKQFLLIVGACIVGSAVVAIVGRFGSPAVKRRTSMINSYILLIVLGLIILFPIYITIVNSFLSNDQISSRPPKLFPSSINFDAYTRAWNEGEISSYLFNSAVVTLFIVSGQLFTSICAGYAFAFLEFPLKRVIFVVFLATLMVPFEVVFFTNLDTVVTLGDLPVVGRFIGLDTYGALALPFLATGFGAFLVRQSFLTFPRDLKDAAELDGYGHWRFLWRVAVPLARPTIAALALFSFFAAWNQYLWPLIASEKYRTLQVGLAQLRGESLDRFNVLFAGTVLAALPLFLLLVVFQKQLVRGLTAGAVKG
jgi:sn-glycerol 3-phosphate transport system permease protein